MNQDKRELERPYVVCHMGMSLDGKVTGAFLDLPQCAGAIEVYYQINRDYGADAFACGRVTMESSFTKGFRPDLTPFEEEVVPPMDYVADASASRFAVAFDRHGRLGWQTASIEDSDPGYGGAHIVEVLLEGTPQPYLAYLQSIGVSYIFAGPDEKGGMDLELALSKLRTIFGIKTLLLEGGSVLNGAFQRADLVDELSLVIMPCIGGAGDGPLCADSVMSLYRPEDSKLIDGTPWVRYKRVR
ncbi:MAG: dihydrofolate reductase family protein [Mailhella sp.]|nr:dihydrofolate reductase family protein [Mailhella sp.]